VTRYYERSLRGLEEKEKEKRRREVTFADRKRARLYTCQKTCFVRKQTAEDIESRCKPMRLPGNVEHRKHSNEIDKLERQGEESQRMKGNGHARKHRTTEHRLEA
jgi:hypothetical protein